MILIIVISIKTNVFYSQEYVYDVIFTSDIGAIVRDNAYMNLYHPENDIRQPLFAVFAMPFMAIAYTISLIFPFFYPINEGILFSIIQGLLIFWSNILIANLLKINSKNRILFVILSMVMYMSILYTFSLEQYAVAYFWLIVCIYAICNNKQDELVIAGAGGTLLTSLLLAFWIPKDISLKKLKDYVLKLIKVGIVFGCLVCIFGRIDVIMPKNMKSKSKLFSSFVKVEEKNKNDTALKSKLKQYTSFIKSCFISPDTVEVYKDNQVGKYNSIQLQKVNGYSYLGILIFIIALIGLIVTRKEKISQLAGVWMFFSLMLLGTIGWGAKENGMILYILYFGWSFLVLIYQLIKAICEKIKLKYLLNFVTISLIIVCMICNYKGLKELLDFAITSYPN